MIMDLPIEIVDKMRTTFIFYATIVGVLAFYLIVGTLLGKVVMRRGALWLMVGVWLQTFTDMLDIYTRLHTPITWRTPTYYIIYTILMVGLVQLGLSTLPTQNNSSNSPNDTIGG